MNRNGYVAWDFIDYRIIQKQFSESGTIVFEKPVNILLVTDRLKGCADGLHDYFKNSTDVNPYVAHSIGDINALADKYVFDFLVFVGYQENRTNYNAVRVIEKSNENVIVVMFARLDGHIELCCREYNIKHKYDRDNPIRMFKEYLKGLILKI